MGQLTTQIDVVIPAPGVFVRTVSFMKPVLKLAHYS